MTNTDTIASTIAATIDACGQRRQGRPLPALNAAKDQQGKHECRNQDAEAPLISAVTHEIPDQPWAKVAGCEGNRHHRDRKHDAGYPDDRLGNHRQDGSRAVNLGVDETGRQPADLPAINPKKKFCQDSRSDDKASRDEPVAGSRIRDELCRNAR